MNNYILLIIAIICLAMVFVFIFNKYEELANKSVPAPHVKPKVRLIKSYYLSGAIMIEHWHSETLGKHGLETLYHNTGEKIHQCNYYKGKMHGVREVYHDNGKIHYKHYYIFGRLVIEDEWREYELIAQLAGLQ